MSNYTVVEYATKKNKKYYIQVYLRKKSMGIFMLFSSLYTWNWI